MITLKGRPLSIAHAVDNMVEPRGKVTVLQHPAIENKRGGIEEPPRTLLTPVVAGALPLLQHLADALHPEDVPPVHREDGMVGRLIRECDRLVAHELFVLRDALGLERLHNLGDEARQLAFRLHRVLPANDVIADEAEVLRRAQKDAELYTESFLQQLPEAVKDRRKTDRGFRSRLQKRWKRPLELFEGEAQKPRA